MRVLSSGSEKLTLLSELIGHSYTFSDKNSLQIPLVDDEPWVIICRAPVLGWLDSRLARFLWCQQYMFKTIRISLEANLGIGTILPYVQPIDD